MTVDSNGPAATAVRGDDLHFVPHLNEPDHGVMNIFRDTTQKGVIVFRNNPYLQSCGYPFLSDADSGHSNSDQVLLCYLTSQQETLSTCSKKLETRSFAEA